MKKHINTLLAIAKRVFGFKLFGLLSIPDLYIVAAYGVLAGWAIIDDVTSILKVLSVCMVVLLAVCYLVVRDNTRMEDKLFRLIDLQREYQDSVAESRASVARYLQHTATLIDLGQPANSKHLREIAAIISNEKEAQETQEKPDDQPRGGSTGIDTGAPGSEGLPPQT